MIIPDLTGQKVLYPALLFAALKTFTRLDPVTGSFVFGILYYVILKFVARLTFRPADIIVPTGLFWAVTPGLFFKLDPAVPVHSLIFAIAFAFLRAVFPFVY
jgi:hypothetical protein